MLTLILTAIGFLIYGLYRAVRRWGVCAIWYFAAAVTFFDASGVVATRLWGPYYSWNLSHHTWNSLPGSLAQLVFALGVGFWSHRWHRAN
jgi:hypothetical protein